MIKTFTTRNGNVWTWDELPFSVFITGKPDFAWSRYLSEERRHRIWATTEKLAEEFESVITTVPDDSRIYAIRAWNSALFPSE